MEKDYEKSRVEVIQSLQSVGNDKKGLNTCGGFVTSYVAM